MFNIIALICLQVDENNVLCIAYMLFKDVIEAFLAKRALFGSPLF